MPGLQVLDAVSNGTVEMGNTALYYYWGKNPAFTFGTSLPFGLNTRSHISWLRFGGGTEMLNDLLKEYNMRRRSDRIAPAPRWAAGSGRRSSRWTISRA